MTAKPIACVQLPPSLESVPAARSCTTAALRAWGLTSTLLDDVALLLTELTANAIRHAHGIVGVEIALNGDRLTVRVCDEDDSQPRVGEAGADDESGRGLWLVDAIADRWGWEAGEPGKVVWFELTTPASACRISPEPAVA